MAEHRFETELGRRPVGPRRLQRRSSLSLGRAEVAADIKLTEVEAVQRGMANHGDIGEPRKVGQSKCYSQVRVRL